MNLLQCGNRQLQTDVMGHSRPMHSVPVAINFRCFPNSDIIFRRSEVRQWAISRLMRCNMAAHAVLYAFLISQHKKKDRLATVSPKLARPAPSPGLARAIKRPA